MFTLINTSHARASENDLKNFISFPIWGLSVFITNSSLCTKRNFWNVGRLINQPSDILVCDNNNTRFLNEEKFNAKFYKPPEMLSYILMKQVIRTLLIRLGINIERLPLVYPSFPPLLHLISYSLKGCNKWSKLFKKLEHSNSNLQKRERKWEEELQAIQGLNFWGKCYELNTNLFFDNKLK